MNKEQKQHPVQQSNENNDEDKMEIYLVPIISI